MRMIPNLLTQLQLQVQTIVSEEMKKAQASIDRRVLAMFGGSEAPEEPKEAPQAKPARAKRRRTAKAKPVKAAPAPSGRMTEQDRKRGRKIVLRFAREQGKVRTPDLRKVQFFRKMSDDQIRNVLFSLVDEGVLKAKGERRQREYILSSAQAQASA